MDSFLQEPNREKGSNKILIAALTAGVLAVLAVIALWSMKPSATQIEQDALAGAFREGTPEFANYTRKIVAQSDFDRTTKSPTAMGTISMFIGGTIRNFTGKTLTGLEIKVGVVDSFNTILKEKTVVVVPKRQETLENNQTLPVQVTIEGFDPKDDLANIRWKVTAIKVE